MKEDFKRLLYITIVTLIAFLIFSLDLVESFMLAVIILITLDAIFFDREK